MADPCIIRFLELSVLRGKKFILLAAFVAASGIDLELWIIPLSICWLVTAVGLIGSTIGGYIIQPEVIADYSLLPLASAKTGELPSHSTRSRRRAASSRRQLLPW